VLYLCRSRHHNSFRLRGSVPASISEDETDEVDDQDEKNQCEEADDDGKCKVAAVVWSVVRLITCTSQSNILFTTEEYKS